MKRRLVYRDGGSDKFWEVECVGASYRVTFGRTGTAGQTQTKTFESEREAIAAAEKVTAEKLRKGYVDDTSASASPGAPAPQVASSAPQAPSPPMVHAKDLTIGRDKRETFSGDAFVNGWIDVQGSLTCDGALSCLGITLHAGSELRCRRLIANVVDVDNEGGATKLYADGIEARVVRLRSVVASLGIGQPLADLVADGKVTADYIQHNAGDLNPSWDYEKGRSSVLRRDFVERSDNPDSDAPALLDIDGIRKELTLGKNPFAKVPPLVEKAAAPATPERREASDPLLGELRSWISAHPGPQRQLAADLRERWVPRLADAPAEVKTEASRVVKTALASPKLTAERDAILGAISGAV